MRKPSCLLWIVWPAVLCSSPGLANPISLEVLRARQVYTTTHVQLTFGVDAHGATVPSIPSPSEIKRDGTALTGTWTRFSGYTANTGSGLVALTSTQYCDCNVPVGNHTYLIKAKTLSGNDFTKDIELSREVTVIASLPEPDKMDAGVPGPDMMKWDIPEPVAIQGLNCKTACNAVPVQDKGAAVKDLGAVVAKEQGTAQKDTGTTQPPNKNDSGCSMGGEHRRQLSVLLLVAALGLLVGFLRRRS
jgi:hypothetical protein